MPNQLTRFAGIVAAKDQPGEDLVAITFMTAFSSPYCDRIVFDIHTRKLVQRREIQWFLCSHAQADILHRGH